MKFLMDMIRTSYYQVAYDPSTGTLICQGSLELREQSEDWAVINLLDTVAEQTREMITIDLRALDFFNCSGFSALCRFVIQVRQKQTIPLRVLGFTHVPCQNRLLTMFQQCMPTIQMDCN